MPKTGMEARLELVEQELQQLPALKREMAKLTNAIASFAQRMEEGFRLLREGLEQGTKLPAESSCPRSAVTPEADMDVGLRFQLRETKSDGEEGVGGGAIDGEEREGVDQVDDEESQDYHALRLHSSHHYHRHEVRAESYFAIIRLTEAEKMEAAGICFGGEAQAGWRFEERERAFTSRPHLKAQTLCRFGGLPGGTLLHWFFAVRQVATMGVLSSTERQWERYPVAHHCKSGALPLLTDNEGEGMVEEEHETILKDTWFG